MRNIVIGDKEKILIAFQTTREMRNALAKHAAKNGLSLSDIIRMSIRAETGIAV